MPDRVAASGEEIRAFALGDRARCARPMRAPRAGIPSGVGTTFSLVFGWLTTLRLKCLMPDWAWGAGLAASNPAMGRSVYKKRPDSAR